MIDKTDPAALGAVVDRYRVSHVRLVLIGLAALVVAVIVGALTVPMVQSGYSYRYSAIIGFGISVTGLAAILAVFLFVMAALHGPTETFEVRAAGLVHTARKRTRAWPWQSVTAVTSFYPRRSTALTGMVIRDYMCTVRFNDGAKVRFSAALAGHDRLEHAIRANCPQCQAGSTDQGR